MSMIDLHLIRWIFTGLKSLYYRDVLFTSLQKSLKDNPVFTKSIGYHLSKKNWIFSIILCILFNNLERDQNVKIKMKQLLATLLLLLPYVSFVCCQNTALIDAQTLLNAEKNISCADFIKGRADSVCCNYTSKFLILLLIFTEI